MTLPPDRPLFRPTLFLMVGLPGAGKTTLARELERTHAALRLSPDEWRVDLFGTVLDEHAQARQAVIEARLWDVAAHALRLGVSVTLDYGLWRRWGRRSGWCTCPPAGRHCESGWSGATPGCRRTPTRSRQETWTCS